MSSKDDKMFTTLRDKFLKIHPEITKKELEGMISKTKKEQDKAMGMKGAINDYGALSLIVNTFGADELTSLGFPGFSSDFDKYLSAREQIKEFYLFTWQKLEQKIQDALDEIKNIDDNIFEKLNERNCIPRLQNIIQQMFPVDELPKHKDKDEFAEWELAILEEIPQRLQKFFNSTFSAFGAYSEDTLEEGFRNYYKEFIKINGELRYPDPTVRNPYWDENFKQRQESRNYVYVWTMHRQLPHEFMEYHKGVLDHILSTRNLETHYTDGNVKNRFERADRKFFDPLTEMEYPGNYILMAGLTINSVYEFIELLQIWIDSNIINQKSRN